MKRVQVILLLGATLLGVSCMLRGPGDLSRDLSQTAGVELDREFGISLGRFSTWLARKAIKWSDDEDLDNINLRGVHHVQVGVYQVEGLRRGFDNTVRLGLDDFSPQWEPLVMVHEDDGDVFVMLRQEGERIKALLVVVAEQDEWVLVRVRGKLDQIVEDTLRMAFDQADRPEWYAATRRDRGLDTAPTEETDPELTAVSAERIYLR